LFEKRRVLKESCHADLPTLPRQQQITGLSALRSSASPHPSAADEWTCFGKWHYLCEPMIALLPTIQEGKLGEGMNKLTFQFD